MNDFNPDTSSLEIDNAAPLPGSAEFIPDPVAPDKDEEAPLSLQDSVKKAAEETKAKAEAPTEEPKVEAKDEEKAEKPKRDRAENGKFTAKVDPEAETEPSPEDGGDDEQEPEQAKRPSEGRDINRAPAHFLPRAKEKWATVDPDVKGEVYRTIDNMEKGMKEYKESHEFRKSISHFEEMAKTAGTTVPEALQRYVAIDQEIIRNPMNGIALVLKSAGLTPEQYAGAILKQVQADQQNPAAAVERNMTQKLQTMEQRLAAYEKREQEQRAAQQQQQVYNELQQNVIDPFREEHPRLDELAEDIAFFLNSGKIPSTLPERERLEVAYDMAERLNPSSEYEDQERLKPAKSAQRPLNPAGSKSVKGSPSAGASFPTKSAKLSLAESVRKAAQSVIG
jgi:hypothetical protein